MIRSHTGEDATVAAVILRVRISKKPKQYYADYAIYAVHCTYIYITMQLTYIYPVPLATCCGVSASTVVTVVHSDGSRV